MQELAGIAAARRRCAELGRGGGASDARVASATGRAMLVLDRPAQDRDRLAATTAELAEALHGAALRRRRGPTHPARTRTTPRAGGSRPLAALPGCVLATTWDGGLAVLRWT